MLFLVRGIRVIVSLLISSSIWGTCGRFNKGFPLCRHAIRNYPPGAPMSTKIDGQRKQPWQRSNVSRRGLSRTDYKVQGRTLERVAEVLRGTRTTKIDGQAMIQIYLVAKHFETILQDFERLVRSEAVGSQITCLYGWY